MAVAVGSAGFRGLESIGVLGQRFGVSHFGFKAVGFRVYT